MSKERRLNDVEIRKVESDNEMILEGYAVVFNSPATYYGETEVISPEAFKNCNMKDVVLRYNHNDTFQTLARTRNKSLELNIDDKGLYFKANLINTTTNKDLYEMVRSGLIDKCSFAFADYTYDYDEATRTTTIDDIGTLFDVSIVDFPYYEATNVEARSLDTRENLAEEIRRNRSKRRKEIAEKLQREMLINRLENS